MNRGSLPSRVVEFARQHGLWRSGERILVGLSGGPDSVALLYLLHGIRQEEAISLGALHVNYGLRGAESDGDEAFCERVCRVLDVPLEVICPAGEPRGNTQAWARAVRMDAYASACREGGYNRVAVGHTADDRAENVLLQLMRGAGLDRIGYLPPSTDHLIRPLVGVRRTEIGAFLAARRIVFRVDRSNYGSAYARNRIRHEVLPLLADVFGVDAAAVLNEQAGLLGVDAEYIERGADTLWERVETGENEIGLAIDTLESYHPAIRLRVFRRMASALGVDCGRESALRLLDLAQQQTGTRVALSSELMAERSREAVCLYLTQEPSAAVDLPVPGRVSLGDGSAISVERASAAAPYPDGRLRARMELPAGTAAVRIRAVEPGDRMVPFGMTGSKLVADLLAEAGVARHRRSRQWVLTGNDEIWWVLGLRVSESVRVSETSENVYEFVWDAEGI